MSWQNLLAVGAATLNIYKDDVLQTPLQLSTAGVTFSQVGETFVVAGTTDSFLIGEVKMEVVPTFNPNNSAVRMAFTGVNMRTTVGSGGGPSTASGGVTAAGGAAVGTITPLTLIPNDATGVTAVNPSPAQVFTGDDPSLIGSGGAVFFSYYSPSPA